MINVTPTHSSVLRRAARRIFNALLTAGVFLGAVNVHAQQLDAPPTQSEGFISDGALTWGIPVLIVVVLVGLLLYRKMTAHKRADVIVAKPQPRAVVPTTDVAVAQASRKPVAPAGAIESERPRRANAAGWEAVPPDYGHNAFGAYRIDQEVGKFVLGKPHRMDVLASRVPDDRRAIEASLVKALGAIDTDDAGRARARQALEEYGFVVRQSAVLLQGRDAWERCSAARVLGQIGSGTSLHALIEALHDTDSVVRNQAVTSLGQLKQPAAIGALLDIARRHPDIPPSLLASSLSACSVDSLGYLDSASFEQSSGAGSGGDVDGLQPLLSVEDLPSGDDHDAVLGLITELESHDAKERAQVAGELGMHHTQRSVSALCATALHDPDSTVRSAAVSALGSIDHESVFAPVLIALADETPEVRAAAARTLSGLHFDRAAAYTRVMQTADPETLQVFAQACIKTGVVSQAADRLASEDRRQAHEAFCLFSLLARAGETKPIFDVIENDKDDGVRLCAVRVLSVAGGVDTVPKLRELVAVEGMPEDVRTSVLEALYKLDKESAVV